MTPAADELADALRRLLDAVPRTTADEATLHDAHELVEAAVALLEADARDGTPPVHVSAFRHAYSLVTGTAHPVAPPVTLSSDESGVHGTFRLGHRHEGAPGLSHGGILCLVLDHVLGEAGMAAGVGGMTVGLDTRFHAPTPINADLEVSARVDGVEGRKVRLVGEIRYAGQPTVTASAVFVQIDRETAERLFPQPTA
jgi:acyl-coenzyme A thioesterase PaaI-like protein